MAKFNPPECFPFDRPNEWADWKQRFKLFQSATKFDKEPREVQVSAFICAMGNEAEHVFKLFTFNEEDDETRFNVVLRKYDKYFFPKQNVIHERACFYQRVQRPGEKAETVIRTLYDLSEHCDFSEHRDEHIQDRIVLGILDKELLHRLQLMSDLTLAQTIECVLVCRGSTSSSPAGGGMRCSTRDISRKSSKQRKTEIET